MAAVVLLFIENKWIWISVQLFIILSLYVGVRFFYLMDKPYRHLRDSIEDLEKQDFNTSIRLSGDRTVDKLAEKYNSIMSNIRRERLNLESQGQFLQELVTSSPLGIVITDFDNIITEINPSALIYLNIPHSSVVGKPLDELNIQANEILKDQPTVVHIGHKKYKAIQTKVQHKGFYRNCLILEDITAELLQTEKEAYGRVIRMMSHEVNNSTGAINSILSSIAEYFQEKADGQDWKDIIHVAIERNLNVATFVKNFASVIRIYDPVRQDVDVYFLLQNLVKMWETDTRKRSIKIHLECDSSKGIINVDPVQMEQVFNNIIKNSIESIESNGDIIIEVKDSGRKIIIADNGPGIEVGIIEKMQSEAFFSTKPRGQGIGMMIIREVLSRHNATYSLRTDEDGWTKFEIELTA